MNKDFWNERYSEIGSAYGEEPNALLKSVASIFKPKSKIICIAEGEGRNAIFLAREGHEVTAIDFSEKGIQKIIQLASEQELIINTICKDLNDYSLGENSWDGIVCIFGHFPTLLRQKIFSQFHSSLKTNGSFVIVGYHKKQLGKGTGGPQQLDLLFSESELAEDLNEFDNLQFRRIKLDVNEGKYHTGNSIVLSALGTK